MKSSSKAAIAAFLSTGFISLLPNVLLLLFPSYAAGIDEHSLLLQLGQALAAGALLGDVFLHTLPHSTMSAELTGIWILTGYGLFLSADMLIRWLEYNASQQQSKHHSHSHSKENGSANDDEHSHTMRSSAIHLNLAADALHNFTDGLAVGASYAAHKTVATDATILSLLASRGGLATLSVLFHEIPHEVGDFCTLVRAGYSARQAVQAQFVTAVAAFGGTAAALYSSLQGGDAMGDRLMLITAGGFVYLAATTILPDVLAHADGGGGRGGTATLMLLQLLSFAAGVGFMYVVLMLEEHDNEHAYHHYHHHDEHHHHEHNHLYMTTPRIQDDAGEL